MPTRTARLPLLTGTEAGATSISLVQAEDRCQERLQVERRAIGRELHDELGGSLAAIHFDLAWIGRHTDDPALLAHVDGANRMLQQAIGAIQRIAHGLRSDQLTHGLAAAVRQLASDCQQRTGMQVVVQASLGATELPPAIELAAFRVAQESLVNAVKHAACTRIDIVLSDRVGLLTLEVTDNGCGLAADATTRPAALGLSGMRERAQSVGGWLDLAPRQGGGTVVSLSIPLATPQTFDQKEPSS